MSQPEQPKSVRSTLRVVLFILTVFTLSDCLTQPAFGYAIDPQAIIITAQSLLGAPYRRGGESPRHGFDCSGLVHWVFGQHGIELNRTARGQHKSGRTVQRRELQPGDLVFFSSSKTKRRITHVGIYVGRGRFIHAASGQRRVQTSSLAEVYWARHFVGAKRVLSLG